jgi:tRNA threonylcarbamoyladenosine biosynthesis protein TsaB
MRILALEFSSRVRSVAAWDSGGAAARPPGLARESEARATPVFTLIETALRAAGLKQEDIQRLAVGLGPGSAMGIRAAVAVAQGWYLARGVTVAGFNSLDVLAAGLHAAGQRGRVDLACDAQRGEWHVAGYELEPAGPHLCEPLRLASHDEMAARIRAGRIVLGPDIAAALPGARDAFPEAAVLARLAAQAAVAIAPENLAPIHLRAPSFVKAAVVFHPTR